MTYRWIEHDAENRLIAAKQNPAGSYLLAFWHQHVFAAILSQTGYSFAALASRSASGRVIGAVLDRLGYRTVYGSADRDGKEKGGMRALIELSRCLQEGRPVGLAVDGSIGPRNEVKPGIVLLSGKQHATILPLGLAASRNWYLKTWDRTEIPKPWARIHVCYGEPIAVPGKLAKDEIQNWQNKVAASINEQGTKAEQWIARENRI